jgi:hypothetical protein
MNKTAKAQRCFSLAFYVTTNGNKTKGSTTQAQLTISTSEGNEIMVKAQLDTGGSQNLASRELLQNINTTDYYKRLPMKMITVNGDTPPYNNMGELHFNDNKGNPVVLLCYVQEQPIHGYNHFALISSDALVDIAADINYPAKMSKAGEILPLQRESETAYHYSDISTISQPSTCLEKKTRKVRVKSNSARYIRGKHGIMRIIGRMHMQAKNTKRKRIRKVKEQET